MEFTSVRRHNHIPQYVSSLVTGWNPRVFYCFEEKKHHLPRDTDFICQNVFVFSLIDISFWSRSGYSNHGFRMRNGDGTDLLPILLELSVKVIFYQENQLQMFHQKGHVTLEAPASSFLWYLAASSLLSASSRQQPLIQTKYLAL